jgi:hypothetical protein
MILVYFYYFQKSKFVTCRIFLFYYYFTVLVSLKLVKTVEVTWSGSSSRVVDNTSYIEVFFMIKHQTLSRTPVSNNAHVSLVDFASANQIFPFRGTRQRSFFFVRMTDRQSMMMRRGEIGNYVFNVV